MLAIFDAHLCLLWIVIDSARSLYSRLNAHRVYL